MSQVAEHTDVRIEDAAPGQFSGPDRRRRRRRSPVLVVAVGLAEHDQLELQFGAGAVAELQHEVAGAFAAELTHSRVLSVDGRVAVLIVPHHTAATAERALGRARARVAGRRFSAGTEMLLVTPLVGFVESAKGDNPAARRHAIKALDAAVLRLDLVPVGWTPSRRIAAGDKTGLLSGRYRLPAQLVGTYAVALGVPYVVYTVLGRLNAVHSAITAVYVTVTLALLATALSIYAESFAALDPPRPPDEPASAAPSATAIIAAYLPNEAATIVETVRVFLSLDYEPGLQVILAYNTPVDLPVELELALLEARNERFVMFKCEGSTSKAQNINAALSVVTGEVVGIFDADHHPAVGSFERAWRWLSHGYGVVQGHCVIRNGANSWVSRTVAVEFESIYALSHPGRAQMHGFGIFGGSNGYWRADLLREVRLRGTMLTEDIDSSLRVNLRGARIANDPGLISRELAPTRLSVLTGQRLRWAQGWSQVSLKYLWSALSSSRLGMRQKLGTLVLLGWRELYPWLTLQMIPLVVYVLAHPTSTPFNWFVPLLMLSTIITFAVGPVQALLSYVVAVPELRAHRRWFVTYGLFNAFLYVEYKNALARVAHVKHLLGEEVWRVTERDPSPAPAHEPVVAALTGALSVSAALSAEV